MKASKRKKLEAAGWCVGSADDFLDSTAKKPLEKSVPDLRVPDGWTLEPLEREPDHALLSTPLPWRYFMTIDFRRRGLRSGYCTTGLLLGEAYPKKPKKYDGRGWKQALVDDAIAHLQKVLR